MRRPIYAAALGLVLAILYLYTGKLWLPMLYHFGVDFLNYAVNGGIKAQVWSGTLSDGVSSLVSIVVPVAIAIWIMTGKRKLVIDENIERLLGENNIKKQDLAYAKSCFFVYKNFSKAVLIPSSSFEAVT